MAFNLDTFREAHRPWTFTAGGVTWTARHVSAPETKAFEDRLARAGATEPEKVAAVRWILRRAFPWRFSYLLRGDPVRVLLGLDVVARGQALNDFFACLLGTTRTPQQKTPTTNGRKSSASTPLQTV